MNINRYKLNYYPGFWVISGERIDGSTWCRPTSQIEEELYQDIIALRTALGAAESVIEYMPVEIVDRFCHDSLSEYRAAKKKLEEVRG